MAIREIQFMVTENGISPSTEQEVGMQGEHRATMLEFCIEPDLYGKLQDECTIEDKLVYRFDCFDSAGGSVKTDTANLDSNFVRLVLDENITRNGGKVSVYLIVTKIRADNTELEVLSRPAKLRLCYVPQSESENGDSVPSISTLAETAKSAAARAETSAAEANNAKEVTQAAKLSLTNGAEFIFLGGDAEESVDIELVVDNTLLEGSANPVQNGPVASAIKTLLAQTNDNTGNIEIINNHVKELESLAEKLNERPYVIERGTKDIWAYEKWSDGTLKCYGRQQMNSTFETSWGNMFRSAEFPAVAYPFEFGTRPIESATVHSGINYAGTGGLTMLLISSPGFNSTTQTAKYSGMRPSQSATVTTLWIDYAVEGKIKE